MTPAKARLYRAYLNASRSRQGKPLYQAIVLAARELSMAGASVFLVDYCYGTHRQLRDARSEYLFVDVPVVVEIVDTSEKVDLLESRLAGLIVQGFATDETVEIIRYIHHGDTPGRGSMPFEFEQPVLQHSEKARTTPMPAEGTAHRVTIYVGSADTWHGQNLAMAIIERCQKLGIAGATACLGVMGFGKSSRIHRAHFLGLSEDLPERIEIVDSAERIEQLIPILETMVEGGLVIRDEVRTIHYGHPPARNT